MKNVVLWLLMMLASCYALAQDRGNACRDDARQFCPQATDGKTATDCLLDHQQDISDRCYDTLKQRIENKGGDQVQSGAQACKQDAKQFCSDVQPGGGRIVKCLKDHQKDVSDACYDSLSKRAKGAKGKDASNAGAEGALSGSDAAARYSEDQKICAEQPNANLRMQCLRDAKDEYSRALNTSETKRAADCNDCGKVTAVKVIEKEGKSNAVGMIAGGVAGAVLGHQVGGGVGKDIATVAGAAGGAYAGNKIEGKMKATKTWVVSVRFDSGNERTFSFETAPDLIVGDLVKSSGNSIVRR